MHKFFNNTGKPTGQRKTYQNAVVVSISGSCRDDLSERFQHPPPPGRPLLGVYSKTEESIPVTK